MKRTILLLLIVGIIGLAVGYLIFARTGSGYVSIQVLISPSKNVLDDLVNVLERLWLFDLGHHLPMALRTLPRVAGFPSACGRCERSLFWNQMIQKREHALLRELSGLA